MAESVKVSLRSNTWIWCISSTNIAKHICIYTCIHTHIHAYIHTRIYVCNGALREIRFTKGFPMICVVHVLKWARPIARSSWSSSRGCRRRRDVPSASHRAGTPYVQYVEPLSTPHQPPYINMYIYRYVSI